MFEVVHRFFASWRFPVSAISILMSYVAFLGAVLLTPDAPGSFAEDFKIWCFGYDPASGDVEWAYVWMFLVQPVVVSAAIAGIWWKPIRDGLTRDVHGMIAFAGGGVAGAVVLGLGLLLSGPTDVEGAFVQSFPAEELRIAHEAPTFELTDQHGRRVSPADFDRRVVLMTAVYTRCAHTCPMTMAQAKRIAGTLTDAERAELRIVVLTLDPGHDSPAVMSDLGDAYGVSTPLFHLLSGDSSEVNATLDAYEFARRRDEALGTIDHSNLAVLIDKEGRVAYRLAMVPSQEEWLNEAVRILLGESPAG